MNIEIEGLSFSYPEVDVFHDVTIELDRPELYGILGPNGVGKSTLIHCINRILEPTGGTVLVDGTDVDGYRLKELAKKLGYVPCASSDTFPMTVVDTVLIGRYPHSGWCVTKHDYDVVYETIHAMGLDDLAMRPFNELSAGQKQKVMLARGLVQQPSAILLDEPTANLDIRHQYGVTKMLKRITRDRNMLIVMVCHDLNIASMYCDRIILMSEGTVYRTGTPQEVITEANIRKVYGVECKVIDNCGCPHVIVCDDGLDESAVSGIPASYEAEFVPDIHGRATARS